MKHIYVLILIVVTFFGIIACSKKSGEDEPTVTTSQAQELTWKIEHEETASTATWLVVPSDTKKAWHASVYKDTLSSDTLVQLALRDYESKGQQNQFVGTHYIRSVGLRAKTTYTLLVYQYREKTHDCRCQTTVITTSER